MKSEGETSEEKPPIKDNSDDTEKSVPEIVTPKSPTKSVRSKKSGFSIKKLKLKGKATSGSQPVVSDSSNLGTGQDMSSEAVERQTPEGDDSFAIGKSVSETNLVESTWRSAENISIGKEDPSKKRNLSCEEKGSGISSKELTEKRERTKSLENLKAMPAYGDLILDPNTSNATPTTSKPKDHLYKILVIGDGGTGKTSIIKRYVHRFFTQHYRSTIGVDFALKVLNWDENTHIRLQLWDIAGQERYGNMTRVYYKEAVGAFVVFDVTRSHTFDSVANWKADLDSKVTLSNNQPVPCVLLANKCDQPKEGIVNNVEKMNEYCKEKGFTAWFETSARDNINIDEAARALVQKILENDSLINNDAFKDGDQFSLTKDSNTQSNGKKACSC